MKNAPKMIMSQKRAGASDDDSDSSNDSSSSSSSSEGLWENSLDPSYVIVFSCFSFCLVVS